MIKSVPNGYKRVDIVADTYQENSIKSLAKRERGSTDKVTIKLIK